jgi:hypothetical protein
VLCLIVVLLPPGKNPFAVQLNIIIIIISALCECSSEELCASVPAKSGLENRDYGPKGSAALAMRHSSIRKSWH